MDLDPTEKEAFASEVTDRLEEYTEYLLDFESAAEDQSILHKLFRVAHTIKGNAGFVGLDNMVRIAHAAENLLSLIRDGKMRLDQELTDLLFETGDLIKQILSFFMSEGEDPLQVDVRDCVSKIEAAIQQRQGPSAPATKEPETRPLLRYSVELRLKSGIPLPGMRAYLLRSKLEKAAHILQEAPSVEEYDNKGFAGQLSFLIESEKSKEDLQKILRNHEVESCEIQESFGEAAPKEEPQRAVAETPSSSRALAAASSQRGSESDDELLFQVGDGADKRIELSRARSSEALRVPIEKIDDILNLVGELLSANSAYLALAADFRAQFGNRGLYVHLRDNSEELSRISAELQEKVMRVRMVPISSVFNRFRRLFRDYNAHHPNKEAVLTITGETTEVDKKQMDSLYDPLIHLLRNALDHGIEEKEVRKSRGKSPQGQIELRSYQDGNTIYIEVSDDGQGLDFERIRKKAVERGLVSAEKISHYSEAELQALIFLPGFSTAAEVTDISGRGVGMDVVRKNIEAIGGSIHLESKAGEGSTFRIQIPLSMAVVTALKIYIRRQLFAIPISVILETTKVVEKDITKIENSETIRLRDEHISLIRVDQAMGFPEEQSPPPDGKRPVVIIQYGESKIALMVDELIGYEDMVIKSLSKNYEEIEGIAGAALLGRGEICLILDAHRLINGILNRENQKFEANSRRLLAELHGTASPSLASADTPLPEARREPSVKTAPRPAPKAGLSSAQLSIIKEIISHGRKAALSALRKLTANTRLRMKVSSTRVQALHRFEETITELCAQEDCQAYYVELTGDIRGNEIALLHTKNMLGLSRMLYQDPTIQRLDEEALSAIQELTNILSVSFTNAISAVADLHVLPSPPYHVPRAHDLFTEDRLFEKDPSATILLVETEFIDEGDSSMLLFYLMPDKSGFARLLETT